MNDVPPVTYPVGRTPLLGGVLLLFWIVGGASLGAGVLAQPRLAASALGVALLLLVWLSTGMLLIAFWRGQAARALVWDGERWHMSTARPSPRLDELRLTVRLDGQKVLLIRGQFPPQKDGVWLWAQASVMPARWHLLRCALYSRADDPLDATASDGLA